MKILCIDKQGAALDFLMRCQDDGHSILWWMKETPKTEYIGCGIIPVIKEWEKHIDWADIIFLADNTVHLDRVDKLRADGYKIFGPSKEAADWELDREKGQEIFRKHGIKVPPYKIFNNYDKAIEYVKKEDRRFVSKPSGDADKALSYVAKSPEDLVYMLERWKKANKLKGEFILQEFVGGIEMAVGGWFGAGGFNKGWCENWEFKKLMNDDKGPATGEQGTILRFARQSKLAKKVLAPLEDALDRLGYVGYVDVNCIIAEDGTPYPLEFTMRPGYPTLNIQMALHKGDHGEFMMDLIEGTDSRNFEMDTIACGVVVAIPDYPYSHLTRKDVVDIPVYGLTDDLMKNIHFCEMKMGKAPQKIGGKIIEAPCFVTGGDYLLVASGTGETVSQASKASYELLDKIDIPNSPFWRTDIGDRLKKQLLELQAMGYALGMDY